MDGIGGSSRGEGAGRASDNASRAEAAEKAAEKAAAREAEKKAAAKKAEEAKQAAQQKQSLMERFKDTFTAALQPGQRERALQVTREAPPGSVGAAINTPLAAVTRGVGVGNWLAGDIGDFYESQRSLLNSPATRQNVDTFARLETEHFQSRTDWAGWLGSSMSAEWRAEIINHSAAVNERWGDSVRQGVNIATDPLGSMSDWTRGQ